MIKDIFKDVFQDDPIVVRSPGRINLLGEHTDYNEGFVLPAAIDKGIGIAVGKREDDQVVLYAAAYDQEYHGSLLDLQPSDLHWPNYILGVADQIQKKG